MALIKCEECGKDISTTASSCPNCGKTRSPWKAPVSGRTIIGVIIAIALGLYVYQSSNISNTSGALVLPSSPLAPAPVVTMAEYNRVSNGMTYKSVTEIVGAPGQENARNDIGGTLTVMYSWTNSNGSGMNAMFQGGELIQKAQFGLQ